jgi:F-type H+-transporting ATPase subunit b
MLVLALAGDSVQLVPDGTMLFHMVVVLVMVGVLNATLLRPINKILEERERRTRGRLAESREILKSVEEKLGRYEQALRQARADGYRMLEQVRANAMQEREQKLNSLRQEISEWTAKQKLEISRQVEEARRSLVANAREFALEIGAHILRRPLKNVASLDIGSV